MSHQDSADRRISFASLEAIFEFLLPEDLDQTPRHGNASVSLRTLAAMAIVCWGWSTRRTLTQRMDEAAKVVSRLFSQTLSASRQGVLQALDPLGYSAASYKTKHWVEGLLACQWAIT